MRLATQETNIDSNFEDAEGDVEATLNPKALKKLIAALTEIYPNFNLAVVREYSANGYDANVVAGVVSPIQVFLPSLMSPYFIVKDEGCGMTREDMETGYIVYGASTKEEDDEQFGAYGLGSKSALNICSSFSVVSVKNGMKVSALIYKGKNGIARLRILSDEPTDEPNGTTVSIPTEDVEEFRDAAERIFATWPKGTVLVDGVAPACIEDDPDYRKIDDLGYVKLPKTARYQWQFKNHQLKVILGGITYRVGEFSPGQMGTVFPKANPKARMFSPLEILLNFESLSALPILPSREEIAINPQSIDIIAERVGKLMERAIEILQADVSEAPDILTAVKRHHSRRILLGTDKMVWRGEEIPEEIYVPGLKLWTTHTNGNRIKQSHRFDKVTVTDSSNTLYVNTYGCTLTHSTILKHIGNWSLAKGQEYKTVALVPLRNGKFDNVHLRSLTEAGVYKLVPVDDILEVSRERMKRLRQLNPSSSAAPTERQAVTYPTFRLVDDKVVQETKDRNTLISEGHPVYYFQQEKYSSGVMNPGFVDRYDRTAQRAVRKAFKHLPDGSTIVMISPQRKATALTSRLEGNVPWFNAQPVIRETILKKAVENTSTMSERLASALSKQNYTPKFLKLDHKDMKSKAIKKTLTHLEKGTYSSTVQSLTGDISDILGIREFSFKTMLKEAREAAGIRTKTEDNVLEKFFNYYPLLRSAFSTPGIPAPNVVRDMIAYVNMVTERDGDFKD